MALVAYDVSDASGSEGDEDEAANSNTTKEEELTNSDTVNNVPSISKIDVNEKQWEESVLCSKLPVPRAKPLIFNSDLSKKLLLSKPAGNNKDSKKSVKIAVPSLSDFDEDLPTPTVKKIAQSTKGSGLFAILPPPKNSATLAKEKRLMPDVLKRPPTPRAVAKAPIKVLPKPVLAPPIEVLSEEEDDDEEEGIDFLGLNKRNEPEPAVPALPDLPITPAAIPLPEEHQPNVEEAMGVSMYPPTTDFVPMSTSEDIELDDEALQKLCGGNKRRRTNVQAQLIDVSEADVVPDKNEWMIKQLTEEKTVKRPSHKKNSGPSSQQKRKHQITYLAFQAKEQEQELQNQWAQNRMTKKQTQSKYGF